MKFRKIQTVIASCLCLVQSAAADVLVLTDGEKIEGRVIREDADNYVIEVAVSETIKDEKIIPKSEVISFEKQPADEKAFAEISDFVPTPELLGVESYEARIAKVEEFLNDFPESGKVAKAKEIFDSLNEELDVVKAGGIKLGEEMVSAADYEANAYEYDAIIAANEIDAAINRRDFLDALRFFSAYDETFSNAAGREELVEKIKQVLAAFSATLDSSLASLDSRIERRKAGLERMSPENRVRTKRALEDEMASIEERFEKEKSEKVEWVTPDAYHKESLDAARRRVESEIRRLESKRNTVSPETPLAEVYRNAWARLAGGSEEEKKTLLGELKSAGMPEVYLVKLRERAGIAED